MGDWIRFILEWWESEGVDHIDEDHEEEMEQ